MAVTLDLINWYLVRKTERNWANPSPGVSTAPAFPAEAAKSAKPSSMGACFHQNAVDRIIPENPVR
jgi:hypothetical protein